MTTLQLAFKPGADAEQRERVLGAARARGATVRPLLAAPATPALAALYVLEPAAGEDDEALLALLCGDDCVAFAERSPRRGPV